MLENQGAPWYPFIEVQHPINVLIEAELRQLAENCVEDIVRLLTRP